MERTARETAIADLKAMQDKMQDSKKSLAPDEVNAMFAGFIKAVEKIGEAPAAPTNRKMRFETGDASNRRAMRFGSLPVEVQKGLDECVIASVILKKPVRELKMFDRLSDESPEFKKAMDSTTGGEGDEWVPTGLSPALVEEVTKMGGVTQMHPHIPMPTQPYELPLQIGRLTAFKVSEQTADTSQTKVPISAAAGITDKLTLSAEGIGVRVLASKYVEEDSIIPILPFLRTEIIAALARGEEEATINGDTSGTHQDNDTTGGGTDRRNLWKGYRKHALENSYSIDFGGGGNSFDWETMLKIRAQHGKYGINPQDLFWLMSLQGYFKSLSLKDSANNAIVTTIDKMPAATIVTGQLGMLGGSQILVSEFQRDDVDATGVNSSGGPNTLSTVLSVQKSGFIYGDRRQASVQLLTEVYAESEQDALLAVLRRAFAPLRPIASNAAVAIGINLTIA